MLEKGPYVKIEEISKSADDVTLKVQATAEETAKAIEEGLALFIEQFELGALEGETPLEKITGAVGEENAGEIIKNAVMSYLIPQALAEEKIVPLTNSDVDSDTVPVQGQPYEFTMTVVPKPSFKLTDYSTFTVSVPEQPQLPEEDLDAQVRGLIAQVCASLGEEAPSEPTDAWVEDHFGHMGITTAADLRERQRQSTMQVLQERYQEIVLGAIMDVYFDRVNGQVSDKMVAAQTTDMLENFKAQLVMEDGEQFEYYLEKHDTTEAEVYAALAEQAKVQLLQGIVLDAIFEHENLTVELPDLMAMVHTLAPGQEEETFDELERAGRTFLLKEGAQRNKALGWIMENITVEVIPDSQLQQGTIQ